MDYLSNLIILSIIIYISGISFFILGIILSKKTKTSTTLNDASIIVCVKNGENSLQNILEDLRKQIYSSNIEFIIVDDASVDKSKYIIQEYAMKDDRFKYVCSSQGDSNLIYKKRALDAGIKSSEYDLLLFTDVDCRVGPYWASSMVSNFNDKHNYVVGYSRVRDGVEFVSKFQQIDFMMLMYASLGSTSIGSPIASTGQNQAYKKSVFASVGGFSKISKLVQGDDSIFLNICRKFSGANAVFSMSDNSFVSSRLHEKWKKFILQRARWAGDANIMWKYNKLFYIYILFTFIINSILLFSPILFFLIPQQIAAIILLKFLFELFLYFFGSTAFNEKINLILFIKWFIIQPMYVFFMGIFSFYQNNIKWR